MNENVLKYVRMRLARNVKVGVLGFCVVCVLFILRYSASRSPLDHSQGYMEDSLKMAGEGFVNIIEEHQEALLYWYSAATSGKIKRQGNTLVHIDGHSDLAEPSAWQKMPLFKMPKNKAEIKQMMEKNDVFIQAAAATGLISRFIWIWPPYDIGGFLHANAEPYVSASLKIGTAFIDEGLGNKTRYSLQRCFCAESDELQVDNKCVWMKNDENNEDDDESVLIDLDESKCLDKLLNVTVEFVSAEKAIELASTGTWITADDSVILDIDEDFYACEAASAPLYNAGMTEESIHNISFYVSCLMCVDNAADEMTADALFNAIVDLVQRNVRQCRLNGVGKTRMCSKFKMTNLILESSLKHLAQSWHVMCLPTQASLFILKKLVRMLVGCTEHQLRELARTGVCMNESPRSTAFNKNNGMMLCKGYNGPNTTLIPYHSVDEEEIVQTTSKLHAILSQPFTPGVITLVRSVRDGYTPRQNFDSIEPKILNFLRNLYPNHVREDTMNYDSELLGGKIGWILRHHSKI